MALRAKVELVNLQGAIKFESLEAALDYVHVNASAHAALANATNIETIFITNNRFLEDAFGVADIDVIHFRKNVVNEIETAADIQRKDFGKNLAEQPAVTETLVRVVQFSRVFDEPVGFASEAAKAVQKPFVESETVTEAVSKGVGKAPIDELAAIGDFTRSVVFKRVSEEALGITNVFARQVAYSRVFNEVVFPTDDLDGEASLQDDQEITFVKTRTDLAAVAESFSKAVSFNRVFTDSSGAFDIHSFAVGKNEQDSSATSDSEQKNFGKHLDNTSSAAEQFARTVQYARSLTDTSSTTDTTYSNVGKVLTDDGVVSETLTREVQYSRGFANTSGATDQHETAFGKAAVDSPVVSEIHALATSKLLVDSGIAIDSFSYSAAKGQTDTATSIDLASIGFGKTQTDPVSFADAGSLVSQGYVNNNAYFSEIYVGTSRSF